jgi:hypothetical protein
MALRNKPHRLRSKSLLFFGFQWALLLILTSYSLAESAPRGYKKQDEYKSADQKTVVCIYRGKPFDWTGKLQVRVFQDDSPKLGGYLLWEGENRVTALVSYDGEFIAINHHLMSDTGLLYIFARQSDGTYKKADIDFRDQALLQFSNQQGLKEPPEFDHLYCHAEQWLTNYQFLGVLSGHMSGEHSLDGFWFIYDCRKGVFTFDLASINKKAFHKRYAK